MVSRGRAEAAGGGRRRPGASQLLRRLPLLLGGVAGLGACDLESVPVDVGDPVVIVHGIMRPDQPQQFVIVERSFTGAVIGFSDGEPLPRDIPQLPIEGAVATVTNLDHPADPCGTNVVFDQRPVDPRYFPLPGVYWAPAGCPTMRTGDRLRLRVVTPDGDVVTGTTLVPGLSGATLSHGGMTRPFGTDTVVFNRDRDTLGITVQASSFRAMQVEVRRRRGPFEPGASALDVSLLTFVDSSSVRIAGDIKDLFDRGEGGDSFTPGRNISLVVGVADTNYFDFARTETNEFTGRGLLNRLEGGIGVFGAVIPVVHLVRVVAEQEDPREGGYRITGTIGGVAVDLELDVYFPRSRDSTRFAAFAEGSWAQLGPFGPGGAAAWAPLPVTDASLDGIVVGRDIQLRLPCTNRDSCMVRWFAMRGRADADTFGVAVFDSSATSMTRLAILEAARQ